MRTFLFRSRQWLQPPRNEVFSFFSEALNLQELTPPWLHFRIVSKLPIEMREGAEIAYRLRIHGFPVRWRSRITVWDPPNRFVDEQLRGPYRLWIHEHRFSESQTGTMCEDSVQYAPLGGALINKLFVAGEIQKLFAYRAETLQKIFAAGPAAFS